MGDIANQIITLVGFAVLVAGGAVYLRSALVKQQHSELEQLAETRGHRVSDLEREVETLKRQIHVMQGEISTLKAIKAELIADAVVEKLKTSGFGLA